MEIEGKDTKADFKKIYGDKTAWVFVQHDQILKTEVKNGAHTHFISSINIDISKNATLHAPLTTTISSSELNIRGKFTIQNLVIENGGILRYYESSVTVKFKATKYEASQNAGVLSLNSLVLKRGSDLVPDASFILRCSTFDMKRYVLLKADAMDIDAVYMFLEREAELNVAGRGDRRKLSNTSHGLGKTGGAHASSGGVGNGVEVTTAAQPYDTIYEPNKPGGEGGSGGKGGSVIKIKTKELLHLDGKLIVSGESSASGGGGAGGSILVDCKKQIKGLGEMIANGGSTHSTNAGAGSGGRVAVYAGEDLYSDEGTYSAVGGNSPATHGCGGPGTIYIKAEKEKLIADNSNKQKDFYATLNEEQLHLTFQEVVIKNYAKVQMFLDDLPRVLTILKLTGDGTGLVRIQNNQEAILERKPTETSKVESNSKLFVNLELNEGGKFKGAETTTLLGEADIALILNGILQEVSNLILGPKRKMTIGKAASVIPSGGNTASNYRVVFKLLQADPGSAVVFDSNTGAKMKIDMLHIKYDSTFEADYFELLCTDVEVELKAQISSASSDRLKSNKIDITTGVRSTDGMPTAGASHGAIGGGSKSLVAEPYGSLYKPKLPGSGIEGRGRGGGYIWIKTQNLINDGDISVNGGDSPNGAGSGGSMLIEETEYIEGYGRFSSTGGSSSGNNGAGSAGRVAIYSNQEIKFEGEYKVHGGSADSPLNAGGGGTVYLEDTRNEKKYRRLLLDNMNNPIDKYISVAEKQKEFPFDEVHLMRKASLHFKGDNLIIDVRKLYGDKSGLIHIHANQLMIAEYTEGVLQAFTAPINFFIDYDSQVIFPTFLFVYGSGVSMNSNEKGRSIQHEGSIINVQYLSLGFETLWYVSEKANTGTVSSEGDITYAEEGKLAFASLDLKSWSTCQFGTDLAFQIVVSNIDVRFSAVISAETFDLHCNELNIEAGAYFTVSAHNRTDDTLDSVYGSGSNTSNRNEFASGAGHASRGGWVYKGSTLQVTAGDYYGSLYTPKERGSSGGTNTAWGAQGLAGKGGGVMNILVDLDMRLDGSLYADGSSGGQYGGGGSGGSILVSTATFAGHGVFSSKGGSGGTGGSGGRTTLIVRNELSFFHGKFIVDGGDGTYSGYLSDGGPGTAYWKEYRYNRNYTYLILDNHGRDWDHNTTLDEQNTSTYTFDEVSMLGNSTLQMKTGDNVERSLIIKKTNGDKTARLFLKSGHTCRMEEGAAQTKTQINIFLDDGAKIYLSSMLYIMGEGETAFYWNGEIIGVNHMRIVPGRNIEIKNRAQTSLEIAGMYITGKPGKFQFSSIEVGAEAVMVLPQGMGFWMTAAHMVRIPSTILNLLT